MEVALVVRNADAMIEDAQQEYAFQPYHLQGNVTMVKPGDEAAELLTEAHVDVNLARKALRATSPLGELHRGDVLMWVEADTRRVGKALRFYALPGDATAALLEECVGGPVQWAWGCAVKLVNLTLVRAKLAYLIEGDFIRPYIPTVC